MWNCPYSNDNFPTYAEEISLEDSFASSPSAAMLADVAGRHGVTIVGGSIPERREGRLYNTCLVFGSKGELKGRFSKEEGGAAVQHVPCVRQQGGVEGSVQQALSPLLPLTHPPAFENSRKLSLTHPPALPIPSSVFREFSKSILAFSSCPSSPSHPPTGLREFSKAVPHSPALPIPPPPNPPFPPLPRPPVPSPAPLPCAPSPSPSYLSPHQLHLFDIGIPGKITSVFPCLLSLCSPSPSPSYLSPHQLHLFDIDIPLTALSSPLVPLPTAFLHLFDIDISFNRVPFPPCPLTCPHHRPTCPPISCICLTLTSHRFPFPSPLVPLPPPLVSCTCAS
ncbi:unnamed protein product [Closterium sp. NIES-64]|nr:unnamed protein product [Closterium sp. NIES-64]